MEKQKEIRYNFRVSDEQARRFEDVMRHIGWRRKAKPPGVTEILLSVVFGEYPDTVTPEERAYLRGELSALGAPEAQDCSPAVFLSQSGKRLGHSKRVR